MCAPESIEQFIEVFLAVIWFGSSSTLYTPSPVNKLSLFLTLPVCSPSSLLPEGGGNGWAWSQNHTTARKPGPPLIIQYSLVCTIHTSYTSRYVTGNTVIQIRHIKRPGGSGTSRLKKEYVIWDTEQKYIYNSMRFFTIRRYCLLVCTFRRPFFSVNWSSLDVSCICFLL